MKDKGQEQKTAEEIFEKYRMKWVGGGNYSLRPMMIEAMEEYASQKLEEYRRLSSKEDQGSASPYFKRLEELQYPHREICHLCNRVVAVGFWVPNEIWAAVVHHSHLNAIHCLSCFTERADEKLINWSKDIKFYAVSLRSHLDDIHNGNDEMAPFHEPPSPIS